MNNNSNSFKDDEIIVKEMQLSSMDIISNINEGFAAHEIIYNSNNEAVNYKILFVNNNFVDILGISKENIINKLATEAYKTEEAPYLEIYNKVVQDKKSITFETYFEKFDKYFKISVFSPCDNFFITIFSDISKYVRANEQLQSNSDKLKEEKQTLKTQKEEITVLQKKFQKIYDSLNSAIAIAELIYDESGQPVDYLILDTNKSFDNMAPSKKEDYLTATARQRYKQSIAPYIEIYKQTVKDQKTIEFETYFDPFDKYLAISVTPFEKNKIILSSIDITARKQVEKELKLSQFCIDHGAVMQVMVSQEGKYLYANKESLSYTGYTPEELLQMTVFDIDPTLEPLFWKEHWKTIQKTKTLKAETYFKQKDSTLRPVLIQANYFNYDEKEILYACIIDLSEQKELESKLEQQNKGLEKIVNSRTEELRNAFNRLEEENKYRSQAEQQLSQAYSLLQDLINNTQTAIMVKDLEGHYILVNTKVKELLHLTEKDIIGKTDYDIHSKERAIDYAYYDKYTIETGRITTYEDKMPIDGVDRIYLKTKFPLYDAEKKMYGLGIIATDITELKHNEIALKRAYNELEQTYSEVQKTNLLLKEANQHKDKFLSVMSHELRTPLNAIIGFSDLLLLQSYGSINEKQKEYLNDINFSANHLFSIISDILDITKIDSGTMSMKLEEFKFEDLLTKVKSLVNATQKNKNITINYGVSKDLHSMKGDILRITQVLLNFLTNAIKFTPENGFITVKIDKISRNMVKFSVIDNGPGIAPEHQEKIFRDFYRIESNNNISGGTGIGLPLCKRLIEMQTGEIGIESFPGEGSTFWFILPINPD
jgi:PAS domain S-box-containing protein